jgi:hypothetical protein
VVAVLATATEPMHVSQIHREVEKVLARPVNPRSIKGYLSAGALKTEPQFVRTGYGYYRAA